MRFKLAAGETLETLTPDEFATILTAVADRFSQVDERLVNVAGGQLDVNGKLPNMVVYEVPPGYEARVHSLIVTSPAFPAGAPYAAVGAFANLHADDPTSSPVATTTPNAAAVPILPFRFAFGTADAPTFRSGQAIILNFQGTAAAASAFIITRLEGVLELTNPPGRAPRRK